MINNIPPGVVRGPFHESDKLEYDIQWGKLSEYYNLTKNIIDGAVYAFFYNLNCNMFGQPLEYYMQPHEFKECIYIGQSSGFYYDRKQPHRGQLRKQINSRMTDHIGKFKKGSGDSSHNKIIKKYGHGQQLIDKISLCLLQPTPTDLRDLYKDAVMRKRFCLWHEQMQLTFYRFNHNQETLGNLDATRERDPNSYSCEIIEANEQTDLTRFMENGQC